MKNLTLENIAAVTGGSYSGPDELKSIEVTAITTDSRKVERGGLFVAIKGERVDGHKFIPQVIDKGAAAAISEVDLGDQDYPYIVVESSLQAVKDIAEFYLKQLGIPVVGITGSVGKTSTKEMTYSVLRQQYRVHKTEGNFNNELGVPLTVFGLRDDDEMAVLEMGISHFGEMYRLAKIARPDTMIVTNIGDAHVENLGSRDGVLKAKTEFAPFLKPGAHVILNGDDDKLATVTELNGIAPMWYGLDSKNDFWADNLVSLGLKGTRCDIHTPQGDLHGVTVGMPGRHMVYNALAGAAAGTVYGLTLEQIKRGIETSETLAGRFNIIDTPHYTIIDDCYNASPVSMKASLDVLQDGAGRKVAVLGDMAELGPDEKQLHAGVGTYAAGLDIDAIYTAGPLARCLAAAARSANPALEVKAYDSLPELQAALPSLLKQGDTLLVKASHCMHFEEIVEQLQR